MNHKKLNIGLFGFGNVGKALFLLLQKMQSPNLSIGRICVRNLEKHRDTDAPFTVNADDIFNDQDINFIVELIDQPDASFQIVTRALKSGRPVVTGNKKMLAAHLPELIELQRQTGVALLYDASACGSIPVIRNLEEYYDNDLLISLKGILNGSSNFVLSKVFNDGMTYADALRLATDAGFVESDPSLDLDGWDALYKLVILAVHAFGTYVPPSDIFCYGISNMNDHDISFANEKGRRVKLVGHVEKLSDGQMTMCVMPQLLSRNKYIYSVEDEFNGVVIKGQYYDKQFMFGRGAGGFPTASAVLSDITACLYDTPTRNAPTAPCQATPTMWFSASTCATTLRTTSRSCTSRKSARATRRTTPTLLSAASRWPASAPRATSCTAGASSLPPIPATDTRQRQQSPHGHSSMRALSIPTRLSISD